MGFFYCLLKHYNHVLCAARLHAGHWIYTMQRRPSLSFAPAARAGAWRAWVGLTQATRHE